MTNAAKHFDPQIGIDIHMYVLVPGTPPVPLPTAHISMVLDPFDYLPFIGATVQVAGVKRATAGTGGLSVHIPLAIWVPPLRAPGGPQFDDELFMGSKTVLADDSPFSRLGMPVLDCSVVGMVPPFRLKKPSKPHLSMTLPTSVNLAIPDSVFVGGPPTISLMAIASRLGLAALGKGFKALRGTKGYKRAAAMFKEARQKLFKNMDSGFFKCKILHAEPVDIRDGSVAVSQEDFAISGRLPLIWTRDYSSGNSYDGMCGYGWQTPADFRLEIEADGMVLFFEANGAAVFPQLPEAAGAEHAVTEFVDGARLAWIQNDEIAELQVLTKGDLRYIFRMPTPNIAPQHQVLHLQIERIEDLCGNHWRFERVEGHLTRIIENGIGIMPGRFIEVHESAGKIHQLSLHDPATGLNYPLSTYKYQNQDLIAEFDALDVPRTFDYDRHHMVRHADRLGLSFYYAYDSEWRVVHAWGDHGLHDYRFGYNAVLRETEVTDSLGHTSLIKFDEDNLPLCEIDPLGGVTSFEYDEVGRTTAVSDPVGSRTEFEYDERGNLLKLLQADGSVISMEFDGANRMTLVVDSLGHPWRRVWDERGRMLEQSTPMGARSRFTYDAHGQLQTHINPRGAVTRLVFDRYGNISQLTDPLGHRSHFEYDALGDLTRHTDASGAVTEYRYDAKGRLLQTRQADGASTRCDYDAEDRLTAYADQNGALTRVEYVGTGQVAKRALADGHIVEYLYNTEEQLIGLVNQRKEHYQLKRDALGRVIEECDYWQQSRRYCYDPGGSLASATDPLGRVVTYVTDRLGRITKKILPDSDSPGQHVQEIFSYDKNGNLIEIRNSHRHVLRKFDADGRLGGEMQDGFQVEYGYDEAGNRVSRQTGAGNKVVARFDLRDQATAIVINDATPILIERDALGRSIKEQLSGSLQRQLRYDTEGHLTAQTVLWDQAPLFATSYDYDSAGNQTRRNDSEHGSDLYHYDPLGNILRHIDPAGRITDFLSDPTGDRLRTRIQLAEVMQAAGAEGLADALWSREGSYEGNHYIFDRAGNLVRRNSGQSSPAEQSNTEPATQLRWDANQRLIESSKGGQVTRYGYDPLGRRVFKRSLAHTTWFFWDGDVLLGEVHQASNAKNHADIWSAGNVADFMAARKRLAALKTMYAGVREYVYYPATFAPLALIDGQTEATARMVRPVNPMGLGMGILIGGVANASLSGAAPSGLPEIGRPETVATADETLGTVFYYHNDPNGCPTRLTDKYGKIVWSASYAAWGEVRQLHAAGIDNPIRFQGQYHDVETGLHYNRYRYYDPYIGQFVGKDPIGLDGGNNLYQYAPNPNRWIDPLGWDWNYHLTNSDGDVYYHGRASDKQSMADVARRHGKNVGTDGARFGSGDTMTQITKPGTPKLTAQGVEGVAVQETGVIGRKKTNGGKVRGNAIEGVNPKSKRATIKMEAGEDFLKGKSPSEMTGTTLKGKDYKIKC
ncbi:RHS repeat-associated core domain-containing protein [Collimonas fungivorans]|uniref:RHS repeat-associated core domain-containing protein n=1 Tax=Collimonas fungivorans TaxID=158899 RepID=UPI003FA350AF